MNKNHIPRLHRDIEMDKYGRKKDKALISKHERGIITDIGEAYKPFQPKTGGLCEKRDESETTAAKCSTMVHTYI